MSGTKELHFSGERPYGLRRHTHQFKVRVDSVAESQITFEQHQSPSLHEAGHALIAVVLGRKLKKLSILHDQYGSGYVCREIVDAPGLAALEEIAISLAGEQAPFLWGTSWVTPCDDDYERIQKVVSKYFPAQSARKIAELVRPCVQSALSQLRKVLADLAQELSMKQEMDGKHAEGIILSQSLPPVALRACLAQILTALKA